MTMSYSFVPVPREQNLYRFDHESGKAWRLEQQFELPGSTLRWIPVEEPIDAAVSAEAAPHDVPLAGPWQGWSVRLV